MNINRYLRLFALIVFTSWMMVVVRSWYLDMGYSMVFGVSVWMTLSAGALLALVSTLIYRATQGWPFRKELFVAFCVGFVPGLLMGFGNVVDWFQKPIVLFWDLEISAVSGLGVALGHLADRQFRR